MEKGINSYILEKFGIEPKDIRSYSPLTLAYIGDGVYDLIIRSMVVGEGNARVNEMNRRTREIVKAHAQSELIGRLMPELTEEELAVYKRGRNAKSSTVAKNATVVDYRRATGLEALIGYLYLQDRTERMMELILLGLDESGKGEEDALRGVDD